MYLCICYLFRNVKQVAKRKNYPFLGMIILYPHLIRLNKK